MWILFVELHQLDFGMYRELLLAKLLISNRKFSALQVGNRLKAFEALLLAICGQFLGDIADVDPVKSHGCCSFRGELRDCFNLEIGKHLGVLLGSRHQSHAGGLVSPQLLDHLCKRSPAVNRFQEGSEISGHTKSIASVQ